MGLNVLGSSGVVGAGQTRALAQALRAMQERGSKLEAEKVQLSTENEAVKKQKARTIAECDMKLKTSEEHVKRQVRPSLPHVPFVSHHSSLIMIIVLTSGTEFQGSSSNSKSRKEST